MFYRNIQDTAKTNQDNENRGSKTAKKETRDNKTKTESE